MLICALLSVALLTGCAIGGEGPADPESPAGRAAASVGEVELRAAELEDQINALTAMVEAARDQPEQREARLADIQQQLETIRQTRAALGASLEAAEAALAIEEAP